MTNFSFLMDKSEYTLFGPAAMEAEKVFYSAPAMSAIGSRKALELAVKWVYSADPSISMPYRDNLQSLIHEESFKNSVPFMTWKKLRVIIYTGNDAVHTERIVTRQEALASLMALFEFIQWIDYIYGSKYEQRKFDLSLIPKAKVIIDTKKIKEQESLLGEKDAEIERLRRQIEEMSAALTEKKEENEKERHFEPDDLSEYETRKQYIDVELRELGWKLEGEDADVWQEYPLDGMAGNNGQKGFADYVLFGRDGKPLAVVEAKKTGRDANAGRTQGVFYADCLEKKFGQRPIIFTTNWYETYFWDDRFGAQRQVSNLFGKEDLQKIINRRSSMKKLNEIKISDEITDRYYQKEAIRAVCDQIENGVRKHLLVMATGTGKTRTASSLVDVLSRGGYITNILFLADRTALVEQAMEDFKKYLPDLSPCNLCGNKIDKNARIVFSTYPTMLNAIDDCRTDDGQRLYQPAHFDLIIVDESHRSIFKKYRTIFDYFDAILVGLTATPRQSVDRNTYDFFELEDGVPTYAYDYETAVEKDHVLVPYYNYEVGTKFLDDGITYDELSESDKERFDDDFTIFEDGPRPDYIPSQALNDYVFNEQTVDIVIEDLMRRGIKEEGGDLIGKTIIFAQNKKHAEYIVERFSKLYPKVGSGFIERVVCEDSYAHELIKKFKLQKYPRIAVSVDMMDTGVDVRSCVNLVFFKKVRSKIKFWQMIGRGTRLCPEISCVDLIDGEYDGKRRFLIFDYCGNFEFFRQHKNGFDSKETKSLTERIFERRIRIAVMLQDGKFASEEYKSWRQEIVDECCRQVNDLQMDLIAVKMKARYVEKYKKPEAFATISEKDSAELIEHIAPIVSMDDPDLYAKQFDSLMYGIIIAHLEATPSFNYYRKRLYTIVQRLDRSNMPQVLEKKEAIRKVFAEEYWSANDILLFETTRKELRSLIKHIVEDGEKAIIFTNLTDEATDHDEGKGMEQAYDFEIYEQKVNRYIIEHRSDVSIYKLTHNQPLSAADYGELERILTQELGKKEDYREAFGDTPFGLLVRRIGKMDHDAAMSAFSQFINDSSLNQRQIAYVIKIINYIENNGYMENAAVLQKPPFDKPASFTRLFDSRKRMEIMTAIKDVTENALRIRA